MNILVTAATQLELSIIEKAVAQHQQLQQHHFTWLTTGVGMLATTYQLTHFFAANKPHLAIQVGIAGAFENNCSLASVFAIAAEQNGDCGVTENGVFYDLFDLKLASHNAFPYENGRLINPYALLLSSLPVPAVGSVTVNQITTSAQRIQQLRSKYQPVLESMEGAALHFVCLHSKTPFLQLRAVSNWVGDRDKKRWLIQPALQQLSAVFVESMANLTAPMLVASPAT